MIRFYYCLKKNVEEIRGSNDEEQGKHTGLPLHPVRGQSLPLSSSFFQSKIQNSKSIISSSCPLLSTISSSTGVHALPLHPAIREASSSTITLSMSLTVISGISFALFTWKTVTSKTSLIRTIAVKSLI